MVSILRRMRALKALLHIRVGLGAAVLPAQSANGTSTIPQVTRLHLTYYKNMHEGHHGARRFWRLCLPRLKYYNPGVGMTVKQLDDEAGPAILSIYSAKPSDGSAAATTGALDSYAPPPTESEIVKAIDVKGKDVEQIWAAFKAATKAENVPVAEEDKKEMELQEQLNAQSEIDRQRVAMVRKAKKDQEAMLEAAKAAVAKQREE
ncbi:50S ribosomal protein Mrp49 [Trichophyton rubrum]|uniref:50S ribosomal protein Mrp49 n=2 Tax=Trichophyton TaxID=5550 RepID=A0A178EUH6_TRIRU|nr:hypothetical protein HL42_2129 [Trichophyton rubrum]OAL62927.1 50S ribosomal protein Mrp49 [Trichophyton rubrum]OAL75362.1 50S ribosomal protein Mrp49 [Trichophyton violaceum]